MAVSFIEVDQVVKNYKQVQVLKDVQFQVNQGEIIGFLGPNGAGKTTMVRLLNGVVLPDGGKIRVGGFDPMMQGDEIRRISGVVTEGAGLYHDMSGLDNLKFFAEIYDCFDENNIQEMLAHFDLTAHQHKPVGTYSTGMKKRLALAKALLHNPSILFLDEPTNGLDPDGIQMVMHYLKALNERKGTTIFLCSHVLHQLEHVCDRYIFLEKGRIIEQGSKKEIERKYMTHIDLRVETGLQLMGDTFAGFPAIRLSEDYIQFTLPSKETIPVLLQQILQYSWVHSVDIANRNLESLYFQVRREHL